MYRPLQDTDNLTEGLAAGEPPRRETLRGQRNSPAQSAFRGRNEDPLLGLELPSRRSSNEGRSVQRETHAARESAFKHPEVAEIRAEYGLSQAKFAAMLGISVRTLQNWEQGRRHPHGPVRVLLRVAARHPRAILDTVKK